MQGVVCRVQGAGWVHLEGSAFPLPPEAVGADPTYLRCEAQVLGVLGFGVWGVGIGDWGLGFGVWGLGFGVWGLGFRVQGLGSRVWGLSIWGVGICGLGSRF